MKFMLVISCTLSFILMTTSAPIEEVKQDYAARAIRTPKDRYRYVADKQRIKKAVPYHKIHAGLSWNKPSEFRLWPELEIVNQSELFDYCRKYLLCIGRVENFIGEGSVLVTRLLKYYYGEQAEASKKTIRFNETREVRMLKCKVVQRVYRFIKGNEEFSAFFVEATGGAGKYFTIVDACRADVFNTIKSGSIDIQDERRNSALEKNRIKVDFNTIRNAAPYQEIHAKMYGDNLGAYNRWQELEDKQKDELNSFCYKYIECMELNGSRIFVIRASLVLQMLKYYIVDVTESNKERPSNRYYYPKRLVRTLKCKNGYRTHRFIRASDGFSVFLIEPTNAKYNLFIIVKACKTSVLNKIGNMKISPGGRKRKGSPLKMESSEI